MFTVEWDEALFSSLDDMVEAGDCSKEERAALEALHNQLKGVKSDLNGKENEIKAWLDRAKQMKSDIHDRMKKKRKGDDGGAKAAA
eukprot:1264736-Pyramimonas_sp.AAC.1